MKKANKNNAGWGFDVKNLDNSVRPQDDFFKFANGNWLKKNQIPHDESRWGSFYVLSKQSDEALRGILEQSKKKKAVHGSNLQKVRDYYLSAMNEKKLNKDGSEPLYKYFEMINRIKNSDDVVNLSAQFRAMGISSLWSVSVDQDMKNKNIVVLYLEQGGLGLPDRDYYLKTDTKSVQIRQKYSAHIRKMHKLMKLYEVQPRKNLTRLNLDRVVGAIMKIETELAGASMTRVERRDYEKQYNKMRLFGLANIAPNVNWKKYFSIINADSAGQLIVMQPHFIKAVDKMLKVTTIEDWKRYLKWKVMCAFANYLSNEIVRERFNFYGKTLSGQKEMKPRWRLAAAEIDMSLGEALGQLYVKAHFPERAKKEINVLVNNLMAAYRERIKALDWMGDATKKKALEKLNAFIRKLGYPNKWRNYSGLKITADSYLENHIAARKFEFEREIKKIGKRPDKKEWGMTPPTVNAYYNPLFTEIVFPAGIMQPPFFDPEADDAVNYGAIGAVIGHELTHGFDDKGSTFDKNGEMKNWWQKKDRKLFLKKAQGLIDQYNKFEAISGVFVNGKLTIGENIADLGGLVIAFHAYQKASAGKERKIIGGFTPEQRFFLGAAFAECGMAREAAMRQQINTDPHSPSKARVNIPLSNMIEFYEAFAVKKGDGMWKPEAERVVIW